MYGDASCFEERERMDLILYQGRPADAAGRLAKEMRVYDLLDSLSDPPHDSSPAFFGKDVIVVSHESPIWCLRRALEIGKPEHNMLRRQTALASVTSFTFENETHRLLGLAYADPAKHVK